MTGVQTCALPICFPVTIQGFFLALQLPFTHGEDGIQGVPRGHFLGLIDLSSDTALYYFVLAIFVLGFATILRAIHSPFGQVLKSIRENEPRAISLGYDVAKFKLLAFVISASLAGVAGSTKSLVFQLASLTDVHWHMSGEVVLMTIPRYRDWETDRKSTRLNSSHLKLSRMPSSA